MINKKYINLTLLSTSIIPIPFIIGCSKVDSDIVNLNNEVDRINKIINKLSQNSFTQEELKKINDDPNKLFAYLNFEQNISEFTYSIIDFNSSNNTFIFKIKVSLKNNNIENNKDRESKQFSFSYSLVSNNKEETKLENEISHINNLELKLKQIEFENNEIEKINKNNFLDCLIFDKKNEFIYSINDFSKNNNVFSFSIKVSLSDKHRISKLFSIEYTIKNEIVSPSLLLLEEIERLNSLTIRLNNSNITKQELIDININNLFSKINDLKLNNDFNYEIKFLQKSTSPKNEINFLIEVNKKNNSSEKKQTKRYSISFSLKDTSKTEIVDTTYFEHVANPITNGSYSFALPGSGANSVKPTNGPSGVTPSNGVPKEAKLEKSIIRNTTQLNQLKNTFSLGFGAYSSGFSFGTGWILDYKLSDDNSYPKTWYIATNSHVIQNLKVPNDTITPDRYEVENEKWANTEQIIIETVKNPKIGQDFGTNTKNHWNFIQAKVKPENAKTIFIGNDYLTTSPKMFSTDPRWNNGEEYIDFAVMEITFDSSEIAKEITQDYVNDKSRHFKYKKESLLKNKDALKKDYYSVLGYPTIGQGSSYRETQLHTSRPEKANWKDDQLTNLSSTPFYNTFSDRIGMFDAALGLSFFSYNYRQAYGLETSYNLWGLIYPIDYANLTQGSSGSQLIDKDGYTLGIHFAIDPSASVGLSTALYCEGFSYQGKFGKYNLEGYDLIEGGFANQKTSYKENLKKLYGSSFKTNLFKNGL